MKKILPYLSSILALFILGFFVTHAQDYTPLAPLPLGDNGTTLQTYTISTYLGGAMKLLIALGAGFSVVMAIIGGTQYVAAGASPSAKSGAKERIWDAFIGLALILTSYLILNSINPDLVNFKLELPPVGTSPIISPTNSGTGGATSGTCPSPNDTSAACCPSGIACQACGGGTSCTPITGVSNKGCGASVCYLDITLLSKIQKINISGWRITESWPPTVTHISACHQNGTCADLNNSGGATDPATIKRYYDAFLAAGLTVVYESNDCAQYIAAGVTNCKSYPTMTNGSSFHVL